MTELLLVLLTGYCTLLALIFIWQRKLLYLPDRCPITVTDASNQGLQHWPDSANFRGFIALEESLKVSGTVIIFHGNAGSAQQRTYYLDALSPLGYRVILAEYPGYGGRHGQPCEHLLVNDALETVRVASAQFEGPIYLWGESLGCGVVSGVIQRSARAQALPVIDGVVLLAPWDTLTNVAQTHYPLLPVKWLVRDHYASTAQLAAYRGRIAVIIANRDEIIPAQHGIALYAALNQPKRLWTFEQASHNDLPLSPHQPWWREVLNFIAQ